jgi:hypothetical protein
VPRAIPRNASHRGDCEGVRRCTGRHSLRLTARLYSPCYTSIQQTFSQGGRLGEDAGLCSAVCRPVVAFSIVYLLVLASVLNSWQSQLPYRYYPHFPTQARRSSEPPRYHRHFMSPYHEILRLAWNSSGSCPCGLLWATEARRGDTAQHNSNTLDVPIRPALLLSHSAQRATTAGPARATHDDQGCSV